MAQLPGYWLRDLAEHCGGRLVDPAAHGDTVIRGVAPVDEAGPDSITWIIDEHHARGLADYQAGGIIGPVELVGEDPRGVVVEDPELAVAQVLDRFHVPNEPPSPGIHPTAVLHKTARLGLNVAIGAHAVIQAGVEIGDNSVIHEGVSLGRAVRIGRDCLLYDRCVVYDRCELGDRVIVHAGTVIGADGFGYLFRDGRHRKTAHVGTVVVEDDVEIGANTTIDRGKFGTTRIGKGSKIDNLVMIAHNVQLGPLCIITGQCGIAGSTRLGSGVAMGGQAGIVHGLRIGEGAQLAAKCAVFSDVKAGETVFGCPARASKTVYREQARVRKLPKLIEQVAQLQRRIAELEAATNHPEDG